MAKRKTLMDEIHEELRGNRELNARFQLELTRLQLANQILKLGEGGELGLT